MKVESMKKLLIVLGVFGFMFVGCAGFFVYRLMTMDLSQLEQSLPGHAEFQDANSMIGSFKDEEAFGNTGEAKQLAASFAKLIKLANDASFSGGKKGGLSMTKGHFLTYCRLNEDSVCFLIHVPQLKRYKKDVRDALIELCWISAQAVLKESVDKDIELAIGLRGSVTYGGSAIGMSSSDNPTTENSFMVSRTAFYKYFAQTKEVSAEGEDSDETSAEDSEPTDEDEEGKKSAEDEPESAEEEPATAGQEAPAGQ